MRDRGSTPRTSTMKVFEVKWGDAFIDTSDMTIAKAKKLRPVVRTTIGFLVTENAECIVLATDYFEKGKEISAPMVIPQGWIIEKHEWVDAGV